MAATECVLGAKITGATCKCGEVAACAVNSFCVANGDAKVCATIPASATTAAGATSCCAKTEATTGAVYLPQGDYCNPATGEITQACTNAADETSKTCACTAGVKCTDGTPYCAAGTCLAAATVGEAVATNAKYCAGISCPVGSYCISAFGEKKATSAGSMCIVAETTALVDNNSYEYCAATDKNNAGVCYGKGTTCVAASGCTCSNAAASTSLGKCKSTTKTCEEGYSIGTTADECTKATIAATKLTAFPATVSAKLCGTKEFNETPKEVCVDNKIMPVCTVGAPADVECACLTKATIINAVPKGTVCGNNFKFTCGEGYKLNEAKDNCIKSGKDDGSKGFPTWAIAVIVVVVVLVIVGVVVGVVLAQKKKTTKVDKMKPTNEALNPAV